MPSLKRPRQSIVLALLALTLVGALRGSQALAAVGAVAQFPIRDDSAFPPPVFAARPGGGVEFATFNGRLGSVSTAGKVTFSPLRLGSAPQAVAYASDGALWISEINGSLDRAAPDGHISHFVVGSYSPPRFAPGANGSMWFTQGPNTLGLIAKDGTTRLVTVNKLSEISSAPGGAVFAENAPPHSTDRATAGVAEVSRTGVLHQLFILGGGSTPTSLAMDTNGSLWSMVINIHGAHPDRIIRYDNGHVTAFGAHLAAFEFIGGIALGNDRNMWFLIPNGASPRIDRITAAGKVTPFSLGLNAPTRQVIAGADGYLWIPENGFDSPLGVIRVSTGYPKITLRSTSRTHAGHHSIRLRIGCHGLAGTCQTRIRIPAWHINHRTTIKAGHTQTTTYTRRSTKHHTRLRIHLTGQNNTINRWLR